MPSASRHLSPTLDCLLDTFPWMSNRHLHCAPNWICFSPVHSHSNPLLTSVGSSWGQQLPKSDVSQTPNFSTPVPHSQVSHTRSILFILFLDQLTNTLPLHFSSTLLFLKCQVFFICHLGYYCSNILIDFTTLSLISLNLHPTGRAAASDHCTAWDSHLAL